MPLEQAALPEGQWTLIMTACTMPRQNPQLARVMLRGIWRTPIRHSGGLLQVKHIDLPDHRHMRQHFVCRLGRPSRCGSLKGPLCFSKRGPASPSCALWYAWSLRTLVSQETKQLTIASSFTGTFGIDETLASQDRAQSQDDGKAPTTRIQAERGTLLTFPSCLSHGGLDDC